VAFCNSVVRTALGSLACLAVIGGALSGCGWQQPSTSPTTSAWNLTEGQRRVQYSYYVHDLVPCMRALRFSVNTVPDLEEFLSQIPVLAWTPWHALQNRASPQEIARIRAICPPNPIVLDPPPLSIREVAVTGRHMSRTIGG
jgi:hypothetical protein